MTSLPLVQLMPLTGTDEFEAPRHISRKAEDFRIHQIAEANAEAKHRHRRDDTVKQPPYTLLGYLLGIEPCRKDDPKHTSMTRQATFPDFQDFYRIGSIIVPLIEQAMS